MSFTVTVDDTVLRQLISNTPGHIQAFMDAQAEDVKNDIRLSFGESPSPPGSPPGVDTGTLRASIDWKPDGDNRRIIHDGVEYGVYLEDGTEKMPPRPFMGPAFERKRQNMAEQARGFKLVKP